jgi:hypothetical protein
MATLGIEAFCGPHLSFGPLIDRRKFDAIYVVSFVYLMMEDLVRFYLEILAVKLFGNSDESYFIGKFMRIKIVWDKYFWI